ncbi:hypothetical protein K469DRAFT_547612 [Zopfia rhizophila CBS 207.26]|uniref:RING-type domain-containing protein n=1 Tax=Zopfia rhizophila CBS 207.26 TaxID=1314779 RepID=A0A6A6EQV6_9PEZI|nr:hypothetical protein K469DRAFT_547612 [Zopfia rhizophila CBS 207.26]
MEEFINTKLQPVEVCPICHEDFGTNHVPVTLDCKHIFGHHCLLQWVRSDQVRANTCPTCRDQLFSKSNVGNNNPHWHSLCQENPIRLAEFVGLLWQHMRHCFKGNFQQAVTDYQLIHNVIRPSLGQLRRSGGAFQQYWAPVRDLPPTGSVTRGPYLPLVRLVRVMQDVIDIIPLHVTTIARANMLFWKMNACSYPSARTLVWADLMAASLLAHESDHLFPVLHWFTMVMSQQIFQFYGEYPWASDQNTKERFVTAVCYDGVNGIGRHWTSYPGLWFTKSLVEVYEELWRQVRGLRKLSLRGSDWEEPVVRGLWAIQGWKRRKN